MCSGGEGGGGGSMRSAASFHTRNSTLNVDPCQIFNVLIVNVVNMSKYTLFARKDKAHNGIDLDIDVNIISSDGLSINSFVSPFEHLV